MEVEKKRLERFSAISYHFRVTLFHMIKPKFSCNRFLSDNYLEIILQEINNAASLGFLFYEDRTRGI